MVVIARRLDASPGPLARTRSATDSARGTRTATTLLLLAVVYAALSQGAYYPAQLRISVVLVLAAAVAAWRATGLTRSDLGAPTLAAAALATWYVAAGAVAHDLNGALPAVGLLAALAAAVFVVRRASDDERRVLIVGLLATGCVLALTGWEGVVWRQTPRALVDGGLWRAASTITYANATAAVLAALAMLALAWNAESERREERALLAIAAYVLVVGVVATASRAGIIALTAGLVWTAVRTRGRVLARSWNIGLGALLAGAALVPSMLVSHTPEPVLAIAGLVIGASLAVAPQRVARIGAAIGTLGLIAAVAAVPSVRADISHSWNDLRGDRATLSSPDRSNELRAAFSLAGSHAITGVGPGNVDLTWAAPPPSTDTMHEPYVHNEYLQTLVEAGAVGLLLLLAGLGAVARTIHRARKTVAINATAGGVAALVALAVHSSFDFLWHVPVVPLIGAVIVGTLLTDPSREFVTDRRTHG